MKTCDVPFFDRNTSFTAKGKHLDFRIVNEKVRTSFSFKIANWAPNISTLGVSKSSIPSRENICPKPPKEKLLIFRECWNSTVASKLFQFDDPRKRFGSYF